MLTIRAMSDGTAYASRHLEHRDYYAEGERVIGHWHGLGAELLGLRGVVKSDDFEAVRQGLDPATSAFLRQRQSADRMAADGTTQSRGRSLYDFTISAPKSVSIMAILGGDLRLIEAHEKAVAEALQELEAHASTRVRQDGANEDRTTGNLALAVYQHDTSRELDPQLHTHAVAANLSYDGTEGRWKALQASGIYERRAYITEVYRNSLARELRSLGYEIEGRSGAKGRDRGFEILGVSDDLLAKYSQRSQQRDKAIFKFVRKNGRQPTDNEVSVLVRESRADKLIEISTVEVRKRQRDRLTKAEADTLAVLRTKAQSTTIQLESAEESLHYAEEHVFERVSVARDHEVLTEALRHGRGQIRSEELKGILTLQESSRAILRDGNQIATADSLRREREMIEIINRGIGGYSRLGGGKSFVASDGLRPEQKRIVTFALDSRDRAVNVCGAAGTGKTATLQELKRGLHESNRDVLAIAPTMSAVEELQKVGFVDAITVERLLQDKRIHRALNGKVMIVDEAGMVSGRQMWEVLQLVEKYSVRIVFSGDTQQVQSVEACDALRVLEKESHLKSVALTEVQRQKPRDYREAIQELRTNPRCGFEKLDAIGAVREVAWADRARSVAAAYWEFTAQKRDALVVCATHEEIDRVTDAIRSVRKRAGELHSAIPVTRDVSLNWTTAQKSVSRNFRPGQWLEFHRSVKGIAKNETVEVVQVENQRVIIRNARGKERAITAKQAKAFDVLERRAVEIAPADKLLLTANRRESRFHTTNGEIVTVSKVDEKGRIHLEDGRMLPSNFKQFAHGYAVTAHRSQGKSVDTIIISGDGMQKELFYVAASRGRAQVLVITSDKERLRESVALSAARQSASELARKIRPGLHQGVCRGRAAAQILASRAAQQESILEPNTSRQPLKNARKEEQSHDHSFGR